MGLHKLPACHFLRRQMQASARRERSALHPAGNLIPTVRGPDVPTWNTDVPTASIRVPRRSLGIGEVAHLVRSRSAHIGWHTLRHSYPTLLKASGADVKVV